MMSSNPRCAHLVRVANQLVERLPDPDVYAAFLFGSAAWGDADAASDLDIMLLLDHPAGYRQVARVRVADLLDEAPPDGPRFADLDRIAVATFLEAIDRGDWGHRVVHSVILMDTNDFYARLRARVTDAYLHPSAHAARFEQKEEQAEWQCAAAVAALDQDDRLAALHARLALQKAGAAVIEGGGHRISPSHFIESLDAALLRSAPDLFTSCRAALALNAADEAVRRSLRAYDAFAVALAEWVERSDLGARLSAEDLAWARFSYGEQTYEEIAHKVAALNTEARRPALLFYLDGLLQVPIRINVGKIFSLRATGEAARLTIRDFHLALGQEPTLYDEWGAALRLSTEHARILDAVNLAGQLLAVGRGALEVGA
ncbi:MAG TPA: nucleotidyltransferase domain-containing protein [Chloroflexota bacterium]|nr:nucleotidyltransferase domain-containing protein [Chloroflexota bacterium]